MLLSLNGLVLIDRTKVLDIGTTLHVQRVLFQLATVASYLVATDFSN